MKIKIFQYIAIILTITAIAGGYFYYQSKASETLRGGTIAVPSGNTKKINASEVGKLTNGLTGYWSFDGADMTATTALDKAGSNIGTLAGSDGNKPARTIGKIGQALDFSVGGLDNTVNISAISTGTTYSVSFWIKHNSAYAHDSQMLFAEGIASGIKYDGSVNKINYKYSSANHFNNTAITQNAWHHIVVAVNSSAVTFYVDGVADGTASGAPTMSNIVALGMAASSAFQGAIDEFRYYSNKALSQSEITELYQQGQTKINASQAGKLTNELINYWSMDGANVNWADTTSEIKDQAGSSNCNALGSIVSTYARPGKIGQGIYFDGSADRLDCGDISLMDGAQKLTISLWIKPSASAQDKYLFSKNVTSTALSIANSDGGYLLIVLDANGANGSYGGTSNNFLSNGNWTHLVIVFDGAQSANADKLKLYANGSNSALTFGGNNIPATTQVSNASSFIIGGTGATSPDAIIDEVRVYSRALSQAEVTELYNQGR